MKLKNAVIGQRVELKVSRDGLEAGATGTIVRVDTTIPLIGVQWDDCTSGHSCSGATNIAHSGWYVYTEQIRKLKEPKTVEITIGSRVRITELRGADGTLGVCVGDVYTVVKVHSDGDVNVRLHDGNVRCMFKSQIKLLN